MTNLSLGADFVFMDIVESKFSSLSTFQCNRDFFTFTDVFYDVMWKQ